MQNTQTQTKQTRESTVCKFLKAAEVSDLTGFSIKTLERWRHRRCGPQYVIVGRNVRYRSDAVVHWMERVQINQCNSSKIMGGSND